MGAPVPVTLSNDINVGYSTHLFAPLPPAPAPPTINSAVEFPIPLAWPPGIGMGTVKKTSTVFHKGRAIIQATHDCGSFIPQITIPPNNLLLPILLVKSKREVIVTCFSVRMNGLQTACTGIWPPIPMSACGNPMAMPASFTMTNNLNSVNVGVSAADLVGALIMTAGGMVFDAMFFTGLAKPAFFEKFEKAMLGITVGFAASVVQNTMDSRYPIKLEGKLPGPLGTEIKVSLISGSSDTKNNPSQVTVSISKKFENDASGSVVKPGASGTYTWDAGGDRSREGVQGELGVTVGSPVAGGSVKATGEYHPDAPEGARGKTGIVAKADTPVASGAAKGQFDDKGGTFSAEGSDISGHSGSAKKRFDDSDGSLRKAAVLSAGSGASEPTVNTAESGIWGPPL